MAIMTVREISDDGVREFELTRDTVREIEQVTGMDYVTIYTTLNTGRILERGGRTWQMIRQ